MTLFKRGIIGTEAALGIAGGVLAIAGSIVALTTYGEGIKSDVRSVTESQITVKRDLEEYQKGTDEDVKSLQASVARIPYIEGKLDVLLKGEGWNPKEVPPTQIASSTEITKTNEQ